MPSSLSTMVADLKFWGQTQASEGLADPGDFEKIVQQATSLHNSAYSCTTVLFTVPEREVTVIGLLALSLLSQLRAAKTAQASTMRTGDFQITRDTPFEKNNKLANDYLKRYTDQCRVLGLNSYFGSQAVKVTDVASENMDHGAMTPFEAAMEPPTVELTANTPSGGVVILSVTTVIFQQFYRRYIYHLTGSEPIHQPWNGSSKLMTQVNESADLLLSTQNQRQVQYRIENLLMDPGTVHRFLVVTTNKAGIYGYSNELVITIP